MDMTAMIPFAVDNTPRSNAMAETKSNVRWECMLPDEYRAAMAALPACFLPLGTVEWHGEHTALGLDSLKAHGLLCEAARTGGGGVVHPPVYGGMGGLDQPATIVVEGEHTWDNHLLRPWLEKLCGEFHRQGFKAIVIITGHYGHNQQIVVRETAARMTQRLQIPVFGSPEYWLALDAGYHGDHAGIGETSLLQHLHPELVDIDRIDRDSVYGKDDRIKTGASPALGKKYDDLIVTRLATLAKAMPTWDAATRDAFVKAERAIVDAQVTRWRTDHAWAAWKNIAKFDAYGQLLVEQRFDQIEKLVAKVLKT